MALKHPKRSAQPAWHSIPAEVMELIADVYLACSERDPERPAYTEAYMHRKLRRDDQLENVTMAVVEASESDMLLDSELSSVIKDAGLTPNQEEAWRLHLMGARKTEIATRLGVSHTTAARFIRQAERRIRMFYSKYGSLHAVYTSETRRTIYRKPSHCSKAHCRRLGYCKFALSMRDASE